MKTTDLNNASFFFRFHSYLKERFPYVNGVLFFILFLTSFVFAHYTFSSEIPLELGGKTILFFISIYFFFFHLRMFDEHKDYEIDCINHPKRILQSGIITLKNLRIIGIIGICMQAIISFILGGNTVFVIWIITFAYSLLMAKEFFIGEFLNKKLILYAVSHMIVTPMMVVWMGSMSIYKMPSIDFFLIPLLSFFSGMAFEISRKIRAPENEKETIQTYSQILGYKKACLSSLACLLIAGILLSYITYYLQVSPIYYGIIWGAYLLCSLSFFSFMKNPTEKGAKKVELSSSMYMLLAYLSVLIATLSKLSISWHLF